MSVDYRGLNSFIKKKKLIITMSRHAKTTTDKFLLIDDVVSKVKNGR